METFLTMDQVAERLQITRMTVYRLIRKGDIKAIKIGSSVRIPENSFAEYLENNEINGATKQNKKSSFDSLMKHFGSCSDARDDYEVILNYIKDNRTKAEF